LFLFLLLVGEFDEDYTDEQVLQEQRTDQNEDDVEEAVIGRPVVPRALVSVVCVQRAAQQLRPAFQGGSDKKRRDAVSDVIVVPKSSEPFAGVHFGAVFLVDAVDAEAWGIAAAVSHLVSHHVSPEYCEHNPDHSDDNHDIQKRAKRLHERRYDDPHVLVL
jgi:hypothetical protein